MGYKEINFFNPDKLEEEQVGYSMDQYHNSLITGQVGDWKEEWLAIGRDDLGDPFIVDVSESNLKVMTANHGEGEWDTYIVAYSLEQFKTIILDLTKLSQGRANPVQLKKNPIQMNDRIQFITEIEKNNPNTEVSFWENLLEE